MHLPRYYGRSVGSQLQVITSRVSCVRLEAELPRHMTSEVRYIAVLASSQLAGSQPFTCDAAAGPANVKQIMRLPSGIRHTGQSPSTRQFLEIAELGWLFDVDRVRMYVMLQHAVWHSRYMYTHWETLYLTLPGINIEAESSSHLLS